MNQFHYDKVLFIGSFAQGAYLETLYSQKVYTQYAANTVQKYYIDGISEKIAASMDVLSALVTVPCSVNGVKNIEADDTQYGNIHIHNVAFPNHLYINQFAQSSAMLNYADKWVEDNKQKKVLIVVYALRVAFLKTAKWIKNRIPGATVICIVPDMPQFMHGKQSARKKVMASVNRWLIDKYRVCVDGYVLYTKPMAEALQLRNHPWTVVEGIYDPQKGQTEALLRVVPDKDKFVFLYGGGISEEYGLKLLVEGFIQAELPNAQLHIYGNGGFAAQLREYEKEYPNVRYFGAVTPDVIQVKMRQAQALVNPRPSNNEFTKYSCPSKIIEYMATARAVLITKLPGIPEDYFEHVYTVDDESVAGMAEAMRQVYMDTEENRIKKGVQAQEYIFREKNLQRQMDKLIAMLNEVESRREEHA